MEIKKVNTFLSTFSFILIIIGYPLVTTVLLPSTSDLENISQAITIPYRAFCLILMVIILFINRNNKIKFPLPIQLYIVFFIFWIFRMLYDDFIRTDIYFSKTSQIWIYIFGICIPAFISTYKSLRFINFKVALQWIWLGLSVVLLLTLFSNQALLSNTDNEFRVDANIALNTISYGNIGVTTFLLTLFLMNNLKSKWKFILYLFITILSFYSILRSGSRGPLLNLVFVLLFWAFSKRKNPILGIIIVAIMSGLILYFIDPILHFLGDISPVIESRMRDTINGTSDDGRDLLHQKAINAFLESPFIGEQFAITNVSGDFAYSHNIILDALMGLGILGGFSISIVLFSAFKNIYKSIHKNRTNYWVSLILLQQIFSLFLSGAFYQDPLFNTLLVAVLLNQNKSSKL